MGDGVLTSFMGVLILLFRLNFLVILFSKCRAYTRDYQELDIEEVLNLEDVSEEKRGRMSEYCFLPLDGISYVYLGAA